MAISCAAELRIHFFLVTLDKLTLATASSVSTDVVCLEFSPSANTLMMQEPSARLRPHGVQNLRGRALWLGKPREKPTRKGADMGTALLWLAAGYALGAASAAMALAAWAVLRTSSECSRAEEAAMLPPAPSGFHGGDPL